MTRAARIPVSLLTGFLGSGKTTILNHLVRQHSFKRTLVLINEFGEIGIDHDLVTHSDEDIVVEMASGCLCCTIRQDLRKTLRDAVWRFAREGKRWFDRVIIETTGLADPVPVLHTLMTDTILAQHYQLASVVTAVDAANGLGTINRQEECLRQIAVSDHLLLTKSDIADPDGLANLRRRLAMLNPAAPVTTADHGRVEPDVFFGTRGFDPSRKGPEVLAWLDAEAYAAVADHHHHHDVNRHDAQISATCMIFEEPIHQAAFDSWLGLLLALRGPDLLRVKGIVNMVGIDRPYVLHGVQHIFHDGLILNKWPTEDRRTRIVFITRNVDVSALPDMLKAFNRSAARRLRAARA